MDIGIIFVWVLLSLFSGAIASKKGRSGFGFFLLAFLLSPLIGIIAALIANENIKKTEDKKPDSGDSKNVHSAQKLLNQKQ